MHATFTRSLVMSLAAALCAGWAPAYAYAADQIYSCQYFTSPGQLKKAASRVDLTLVEHGDGKSWTLTWPDNRTVAAAQAEVSFGCMGRSNGLVWTEGAKRRVAFTCFSDVHSDGQGAYFWLSMKHPSLFQMPGYGCQSVTEPAKPVEQ